MNRFYWHFAIISMLVSGCATSSLYVRSVPDGADVSFISAEGAAIPVGKTPLTLDSRTTPGLFTQSGQLQIVKDGFAPQTALIPNLGQAGIGRLNFTLAQTELPKICQVREDIGTDIARGVAEATSHIQRKRYPEAVTTLQGLISKYPSIAVLYDLKGNVNYLQRDFTQALESYRRSDSISPNTPATLRMIDKIQNMQGGR